MSHEILTWYSLVHGLYTFFLLLCSYLISCRSYFVCMLRMTNVVWRFGQHIRTNVTRWRHQHQLAHFTWFYLTWCHTSSDRIASNITHWVMQDQITIATLNVLVADSSLCVLDSFCHDILLTVHNFLDHLIRFNSWITASLAIFLSLCVLLCW